MELRFPNLQLLLDLFFVTGSVLDLFRGVKR